MNYLSKNSALANGWEFTESDKIFAERIQPRLPEKLFDIHCHLLRVGDVDPVPEFIEAGPKKLGLEEWRRHVGFQVGNSRLDGALFTPMPSKNGDREAANKFVISEIENRPGFYANILIGPDSNHSQIEAYFNNNNIVGFKPYHLYADRQKTFTSDIKDFIPEWVWELADERKLLILLHMVKDTALADKTNQRYLIKHCEKYSESKLVLAHAARGFHPMNTKTGIHSLSGLENVWFDSSAICESDALISILQEFGPRRLMWGSDFPVSSQRGRCVSLGTGFVWITTDQVEWNDRAFFGEPVQVGFESINALLNAGELTGLEKKDFIDIFHDNAQRLLDINENSR